VRSLTCAIGLDIGGTKIAGGVVDAFGEVFHLRSIPTGASRGGAAVLEDAVGLAQELITEAGRTGRKVVGIGISICELVDRQGNITSEHTIKWQGLPVRATFERIAPTKIEADVRAHALAEARIGAGKGLRDFVFVSIGTGISSCLVQDGKPYTGSRGNALVLSTMPLTVFDEQEQKLEFVLEAFASGAGLVDRYRRKGVNVSSVEEIMADAAAGNGTAIHILTTGGEALGSALAWLVNVLDPEAVITGGGLGLADGLYREHAIASVRSHVFAESSREVPVLKAACGSSAGVIGAAIGVMEERNPLRL